MKKILIVFTILLGLLAGCAPAATPAPIPATNTLVSPTNTPIPATNTLISLTNTPVLATVTPAPTASVTATQPLANPVRRDNGAGLIAFLSDRDGKPAIYVMNADGSNQRRLAGGKPRDTCLSPVWSPDGQRIAYIVVPNGLNGDRHGPLEVWSVGLDGAAPVELSVGVTDTLLAYPWNDPIWSPDGTRLAVAALHPVAGASDKRSVITILRSDGSGVEQAFPLEWISGAVEWSPNGEQILIEDISPDESIRAHNVHVLSLSNGEIREVYRDLLSAAWSPDGTEIVVVPAQSGQVLIVKLDGTSRPVGPLPAGTTPELAVWSPDGTEIAVFGTTNNGDEAGLYLVTVSTGQVRSIALAAEYLEGMEYSPDGKQVLVSTGHSGRSSYSNRWPKSTLLFYDLASATLTALTDGKGYDAAGTWAPAPTASTAPATSVSGPIAFLSDREGQPAIYIMNADGSNQRRLAECKPKGVCLPPVWSPDGQRIAYLVVPNGQSGVSYLHGELEIWSVGLDGAAPVELGAGVTDTLLAYPWIDPTWSPDGTRLAVAALHPVAGTSDKRSVVTILRSDGSGVEQAFPLDWIASGVEWASNGEQILIQDMSPDESVRVHNAHVLSLSNGEIREVYRDLLSAAWSPDGTEIVVVPAQSGQVLIVKLDGTARPVGPLPAGTTPELAVWSPDGTEIAVFGTTNNGREASLYLITVPTGQVRSIALAAESLDGLEYSPDGKQVLVSAAHPGRSSYSSSWLRRSLWVYDLAAETLTELTDGKGYDSHGTWSPAPNASTALSIAFASDLDGDFEIWLMNADGSNLRQLTDNAALDLSPAWSPDGSRLAFISNRDGNDELYTMNADGSDARRLTDTPDASESFPAWSPDGQLISFDSDRGGNWDVYIANRDGSNPRRLTEHPGEDWISSWSPDGQKITFESKRDGNYEIYVVNLDGSAPQRLTQNTVQDGAPKWSPDGSKIAFFSRRDGNPEIYIMNSDGNNPLRLTDQAGEDSFPAWSPDGAWLVFSSGDNQKAEIYLIAADGSQLQALTANGAQNWTPAWRPAP